MASEGGAWIMRGLDWNDPLRIRTWQELENYVEEVGFLPLFAGGVTGFSAEEHVSPDFWWTGDREQDPWEWRELIAANHRVAYGKFFDGRAGFISRAWLPAFANSRRDGYDFDSRCDEGMVSWHEKRLYETLSAAGSIFRVGLQEVLLAIHVAQIQGDVHRRAAQGVHPAQQGLGAGDGPRGHVGRVHLLQDRPGF